MEAKTKTFLGYVKIILVFLVIGYVAATFVTIQEDKAKFDNYRTEVTLKNLTLQDAYDAVKNGEANTHTKINYGVKPYITYVYDTVIVKGDK